MSRKTPDLQIEEISGERFPDLKAAQDAAMPKLARSIEAVIRDLLERGILVIENGQLIPNPQRTKNG